MSLPTGIIVIIWFSYNILLSLAHDHISPSCNCQEDMHRGYSKCYCENIDNQTYAQYSALCNPSVKSLSFINISHLQNTNIATYIDHITQCNRSKHLIELALTNTNLVRLNATHFQGFTNLQTLNVSNNYQLNSYGDKSFESFGASLEKFMAISNPVRSLTRDVFQGLHNMKTLILSNNKIGYIETGIFMNQCCQNIRELRLDHNILTVLDEDSLMGLTNLEILDLRQNPLQHLDPNVFLPCASKLIELRLSHNDQTSFGGFAQPPKGLFAKLNRLVQLEMTELKLSNLTSDTFVGLESLRELSLSGNRLIQLPLDLFTPMPQLQHLDLAANWLMCIPSSSDPIVQSDFLSGLPIRWLDLSWNRLTHLNQLSARSLSLFDKHTTSQTRLVLNLTANPWQKINDDTFCNPDGTGLTRPVELVIGPLPAIPFAHWHTSFGLWTSRAMWPKGAFSLVGNLSLVRGLMLGGKLVSDLHAGIDEAPEICRELAHIHNTTQSHFTLSNKFLIDHNLKPLFDRASPQALSYCARLPIRKLQDWQLHELNVSSLITDMDGLVHNALITLEQGSRLYLLVIVGICITFLLVALTVIMCYRAWSLKTSQKISNHDLVGCDTVLNHGLSVEKPLLSKHSPMSHSDEKDPSSFYLIRPNDESTLGTKECNGNLNSKYQTNQATLNDENIVSSSQLNGTASLGTIIFPNSCSSVKTNRTNPIIDRKPVRNRPKSDPEAAGLENINKLTSLGVV